MLDAAITDRPDLLAADTAVLANERRVGLTKEEVKTEVASGSLGVASVIDTGVGTQTPSQLIAESEQAAQQDAATSDSAAV